METDEVKKEELKTTIAKNRSYVPGELIHTFICIVVIIYLFVFIGIAPIIAVLHYIKPPYIASGILGIWYFIVIFIVFDKDVANNKVLGYVSRHLAFWKEYLSAQSSLKREIRYLKKYSKMDPQERILSRVK
jgi:hypothetical protein